MLVVMLSVDVTLLLGTSSRQRTVHINGLKLVSNECFEGSGEGIVNLAAAIRLHCLLEFVNGHLTVLQTSDET